MMKRILSALLAFLLVLGVLSMPTYAENTPDYSGDVGKYVKLNPAVSTFSVYNPATGDTDVFYHEDFTADTVFRIAQWRIKEDKLQYRVEFYSGSVTGDYAALFPAEPWFVQTDAGELVFMDTCSVCGKPDCAGHAWCETCQKYDCGKDHTPQQSATELSGTVTDSAGNPVTDANGEPLCVQVDSVLPQGVTLSVTEADVSQQLTAFGISADRMVFGLDISLSKDGMEYQPSGKAKVKVPVDAEPGAWIGILHTHKGETAYLGMAEVRADSTVEFETDKFSEFAGFMVIIEEYNYNVTEIMGSNSSILVSQLLQDIKSDTITVTTDMIASVAYIRGENSTVDLLSVEEVTVDGKKDWRLTTPSTLPSFEEKGTLKVTSVIGDFVIEIQVRTKEADVITFVSGSGFFNGAITADKGACEIKGEEADYPLPVSENDSYFYEVGWLHPTKAGHTFEGWFDAAGNMVYDENGVCIESEYWTNEGESEYWQWRGTGDLTLYAKWSVAEYTATIQYYDDSGVLRVAYEYFTREEPLDLTEYKYSAAIPEAPWWLVSNDEGNWFVTTQDQCGIHKTNVMPEGCWGNVTLTRSFYIIYDHNDGTGKKTYGHPHLNSGNFCELTWINTNRTGYTFAGWWTDPDRGEGTQVYYGDTDKDEENGIKPDWYVNGTDYWKNGKWVYSNNVTLYAQWEPQYQYTLTFNQNTTDTVTNMPANLANTGWVDDSQKVYTWTAEPVRVGYTFLGWSTDPDATEGTKDKSYTITGSPTGEASVELYAVWERTLVDLTISADVADTTQNFIFTVIGEGINLEVVVPKSGSVTVKDLPEGIYTIGEKDTWSWRVAAVEEKTVDLSKVEQRTVTIGFANINKTKWLNGCSCGKEVVPNGEQ